MAEPMPLAPQQLRSYSDPDVFPFDSTDDFPLLHEGLTQERAEEALRFGLAMQQPGYNVYVLGESGSGRHAETFRLLHRLAATRPTPPDLCYIHNFADPLHPRLLSLPAGRGAQLRSAMQDLIRELEPAIESALGSDTHTERVEALQQAQKDREEEALRAVGAGSLAEGLSLLRTPEGFVFAPTVEGEILENEAYEALPEAERKAIEANVEVWTERLADLLDEFPDWRRELRDALTRAVRDALRPAVIHLMKGTRSTFADLPQVLAFLDGVAADLLDGDSEYAEDDEESGDDSSESSSLAWRFHKYQVKVLVDHSGSTGAPVVYEDNPGYGNLVGRLEHLVRNGAQVSTFNHLRAGALHRACGGYLVLDVGRLLGQPYAWEALKRALRSGEIRIEPPAEAQGWSGAVTLAPEPVPCELKVILVGDRELFYLLMDEEPDFAELFKVAADFDDDLPRTPDNERRYAQLLAALARRNDLRAFDRHALARLMEEGARFAEDARKLSLQTRKLVDLMREADYQAGIAGVARVGREQIDAALAARSRRADRYPRVVRASMLDGTTLISTSGARAGQVNGLVVVDLAGAAHGHPARITATVRMGDGEVVDIERETELGGAIHSKGVLILTAFLASRYARHQPLSLSASLAFEQSYGQVEGDSASLGELCALLSALTQIPIHQRYAVTGSVNQFGEVQVIGGVNEKIEGFFDLCRERGLDGGHGVVIPVASLRHLMLREDVVEAARQGLFHVYAVNTVDEAMEVLTGVAAGEPDAKGVMPKGSLNHKVATVLSEMSAARHAYDEGDGGRPRRRGIH